MIHFIPRDCDCDCDSCSSLSASPPSYSHWSAVAVVDSIVVVEQELASAAGTEQAAVVLLAVEAAQVKEVGLVVVERSQCVLRAGIASRPCEDPGPQDSEAASVLPSEADAAEETGSVLADAATEEAGPEVVVVAAAVAGCGIVVGLVAP